jgi:hypothetical protein
MATTAMHRTTIQLFNDEFEARASCPDGGLLGVELALGSWTNELHLVGEPDRIVALLTMMLDRATAAAAAHTGAVV